jgi:hypothetical protein
MVGANEAAHLVLKLRKCVEMMHFALLIERCYRFSAADLTAGGADGDNWEIGIDHPQCPFDHFTAIIDLGDDPVGAMGAIGCDRGLRPFRRPIASR